MECILFELQFLRDDILSAEQLGEVVHVTYYDEPIAVMASEYLDNIEEQAELLYQHFVGEIPDTLNAVDDD